MDTVWSSNLLAFPLDPGEQLSWCASWLFPRFSTGDFSSESVMIFLKGGIIFPILEFGGNDLIRWLLFFDLFSSCSHRLMYASSASSHITSYLVFRSVFRNKSKALSALRTPCFHFWRVFFPFTIFKSSWDAKWGFFEIASQMSFEVPSPPKSSRASTAMIL